MPKSCAFYGPWPSLYSDKSRPPLSYGAVTVTVSEANLVASPTANSTDTCPCSLLKEMDEIQELVKKVIRQCASRGVSLSEVLAAFVLRTVRDDNMVPCNRAL